MLIQCSKTHFFPENYTLIQKICINVKSCIATKSRTAIIVGKKCHIQSEWHGYCVAWYIIIESNNNNPKMLTTLLDYLLKTIKQTNKNVDKDQFIRIIRKWFSHRSRTAYRVTARHIGAWVRLTATWNRKWFAKITPDNNMLFCCPLTTMEQLFFQLAHVVRYNQLEKSLELASAFGWRNSNAYRYEFLRAFTL